MKNNLGRAVLLLTIASNLIAKDFTYDFNFSNYKPFKKEGVEVTISLTQTNPNIVLMFDFDMKESPQYTFKRVNAKQSEEYHDLSVEYKYILYPIQSGNINIDFKLTKKVTTDESVAYSFSGDRDNVKGLVTTDTIVEMPTIELNVKPIPKDTVIVGDYNIEYKYTKTILLEHEPTNLLVKLKGSGYPIDLSTILSQEYKFKTFSQEPIVKDNSYQYGYAFSHNEEFQTPHIKLKAFNPKTLKPYFLEVPSQRMVVKASQHNTLVDKTDSHKPYSIDFSNALEILKYIILFAIGFLAASLFKKLKFRYHKDELSYKIDGTKTKKELLSLLMSQHSTTYKSIISELEESIYDKESISLKKLQQKAKKCMKN